jgi:Fe-S-cluster containining protein
MCCTGILEGSARGSYFGQGTACKYLGDYCEIYNQRPSTCARYFCAWAQGVVPENMSPLLTGVVISVERDTDDEQYLRAVSTKPFLPEFVSWLNSEAEKIYSYAVYTRVIPINDNRI